MMNERCDACHYYDSEHEICCRFPPNAGSYKVSGGFPYTCKEWGCGEWGAIEEKLDKEGE